MPEIRIAALDLDGTLLSRKNTVTPATRQAIADAVAPGALWCCPPQAVPWPTCRRWWPNCPASAMPSPPTGLPSGTWVPTRWARSTAAIPTRKRAQTSEPACLVRRLFPVEKAREVFGLYQEFEGSLSVFSDGRVIRDRLAQERMGHHLRRLLSLSTEAKQPNDGRFHIVRDTAEWMSRPRP